MFCKTDFPIKAEGPTVKLTAWNNKRMVISRRSCKDIFLNRPFISQPLLHIFGKRQKEELNYKATFINKHVIV